MPKSITLEEIDLDKAIELIVAKAAKPQRSKKKQTKVYLIPESESRDSHTYHYLAVKTKKLVIENQKLRIKKFNPVKRVHEWFVEAKLPPHSK